MTPDDVARYAETIFKRSHLDNVFFAKWWHGHDAVLDGKPLVVARREPLLVMRRAECLADVALEAAADVSRAA